MIQLRRHSRATLAAAVLCAALAMGGAAAADDTGSGNGNASPPPTTAPQDPPSISIDMELCVGEPVSCHDLPSTSSVPAGSATLTVECVNTSDDDDCADTPFDKATVFTSDSSTEKDLVDASASFDLAPLTAGETRTMDVQIRSSTHRSRYSAGIRFNIVVQN